MRLTRREYLKLSAVTLLSAGQPAFAGTLPSLFFSACDNRLGQHFLRAFTVTGQLLFQTMIPQRAHSFCQSPTGHIIAFSRRPGSIAWVLDQRSGEILYTLQTPENRHFQGHGCFSADGCYLFTSENNFADGTGAIGIWDADSWQRTDEFHHIGVEPHDIQRLPDSEILVIADGGIRTHPDLPRRNLSGEAMQPALLYLNPNDGKLAGRYAPSDQLMSTRHLAIDNDGTVFVGIQYKGDKRQSKPLLAQHHGEAPLQLWSTEPANWQAMQQYVASIAIAPRSGMICLTCPRGHCVTFWSRNQQQWSGKLDLPDIGGVSLSADQAHFLLTSGNGTIYQLRADDLTLVAKHSFTDIQWDNHVITIS